jgi:hypothetical protein
MRDAPVAAVRANWCSPLARLAVRLYLFARRSGRFLRFASATLVRCSVILSPQRMFAQSVAGACIQTFAAPHPMRYLRSDFSLKITDDYEMV